MPSYPAEPSPHRRIGTKQNGRAEPEPHPRAGQAGLASGAARSLVPLPAEGIHRGFEHCTCMFAAASIIRRKERGEKKGRNCRRPYSNIWVWIMGRKGNRGSGHEV